MTVGGSPVGELGGSRDGNQPICLTFSPSGSLSSDISITGLVPGTSKPDSGNQRCGWFPPPIGGNRPRRRFPREFRYQPTKQTRCRG